MQSSSGCSHQMIGIYVGKVSREDEQYDFEICYRPEDMDTGPHK